MMKFDDFMKPGNWFVGGHEIEFESEKPILLRVVLKCVEDLEYIEKESIETKDVRLFYIEHIPLMFPGYILGECKKFDQLNNFNPRHSKAEWIFKIELVEQAFAKKKRKPKATPDPIEELVKETERLGLYEYELTTEVPKDGREES